MQNDNSYTNTFSLMKAYSRLPKLDREIVEILFDTDVLDCTYTSLARKLNADISNTRKSLLRLQKLGVVYIVKEKTHKRFKPMVACFLIDGWMHYFLENSKTNLNKISIPIKAT